MPMLLRLFFLQNISGMPIPQVPLQGRQCRRIDRRRKVMGGRKHELKSKICHSQFVIGAGKPIMILGLQS
jgi:hypothetical protein